MQIPGHPWNKLKSSNFRAKLLCSENMLVAHPKIPAHVFIYPVISYCASLSYFEGRFTQLPVVRDWDVGSVWFCLLICFTYLFLFLWASGWEVLLHADQRATFSRQVSVSREKTNRLCLGQVLLTGQTWNFETISRQRRGRGCRWKRGQKEHFVIQLQDMMSVLSGMPVLETHTERRAVYSTTTREIDQDNFVKKRTDSTGKSLLSVRTGLIHFFALYVTLFPRQLHFPLKFPSP